MSLGSFIRCARVVIRASICVAVWLTASFSFAASADRQQAQAELLDHAEFLCDNCLFGPSNYYYCFEANNQILVGYQRTPVLNYQDPSKNHLTSVHHAWAKLPAEAQTLPISYDDKHIWVSRPDTRQAKGVWGHLKLIGAWVSRDNAKQVKLTRSSKREIFVHSDRCRGTSATQTR